MDKLNYTIFNLINSSAGGNEFLDIFMITLAIVLPYCFGIILLYVFFRKDNPLKEEVLFAVYVLITGFIFSRFIDLFLYHPRPFMVLMGHQLIPHSAENSFPSSHMLFYVSLSFGLLRYKQSRNLGCLLLFFSLPGGLARVYCGVHFPMDILGAVIVAALSVYPAYILFEKTKRVLPDSFRSF